MSNTGKPFSVAFVCMGNADDPKYSSGAPYSIRNAFHEIGCNVLDIFPLVTLTEKLLLYKKIYHRLSGKFYLPNREQSYLSEVAALIQRRLGEQPFDFVFAMHSIPATKIKIDKPVIISHDQTFIERMSYFAFERRPPAAEYVQQALRQEREAFENADLCIYPSERSAQIIRTEFQVPERRIAVLPWGANMSQEPLRTEVEQSIGCRGTDRLVITFIGVDWIRKGGDSVVAVCQVLRERGIHVHLNIIGVQPPLSIANSTSIIPYLDKSKPAEFHRYSKLLSESHFLLVPSRAEAYGHVFCEAAAFGVPSVALDVGGVSTIIIDHVTGHCLPINSQPEDIAQRIEETFLNASEYRNMAIRARERYESALNWQAFCRSVIERVSTRRGDNFFADTTPDGLRAV